MPKFLPTYPIELVIFPTENLNLQLKDDVFIEIIETVLTKEEKVFGLIPKINGIVQNFGTKIKIIDAHFVDDGKTMVLQSVGEEVFEVITVLENVPEKRYQGAIVEILEPEHVTVSKDLSALITHEVMRLFNILNAFPHGPIPKLLTSSYDIAHKVGLTLIEEFEFLQLKNELHRQEYLRRHLKKMEPILNDLEEIKKKILMN